MTLIDFWRLMAGFGMFLFGMFQLEDSMKQIEGRTFKLFLKKHTKNKLGAIFSGTIITGILQSSSIVNLILLSFVGAGMISMRNALGVILGANVGGTFNSWILYALGFELNISAITLPVIGLSGIGLMVFRNKNKIYRIFSFCMGFGLLFLGLEFLKNSMEFLIRDFDFKPYLNYSYSLFFLGGFIITAIIQTSAATVVIVLSALHAKIINLEIGVAIVMGAELGTTLKLILGSIAGSAAKKRVALFNSSLNLITSVLGLIFMLQLISFLKDFLGFTDPLLVLVSFQTLLNIFGIILFYFLLDPIATFLEKTFQSKNKSSVTFYLPQAISGIPGTSIEMLEKEVDAFIKKAIELNLESFKIIPATLPKQKTANGFKDSFPPSLAYTEKYNQLKIAEGEILIFFSKLGDEKLQKNELLRVNQLMSSVRNAMYSAKGMKDILHDRKEFSNSANDLKYSLFTSFQSQLKGFYDEIKKIRTLENGEMLDPLAELYKKTKLTYEKQIQDFYKYAEENKLNHTDLSTLFNINRELYSSGKALIFAVKDYEFSPDLVDKFETSTD